METFTGNGNYPYAAIRESYVNASAFLSNLNGEFSNGVHAQDQEAIKDTAEESERKDQENDLEDDESSRQSGPATGDEVEEEEDDEEEDEEREKHNYVDSVQNFWKNALAKNCSDCPVTYEAREEEGGEVSVTCSVGQLRVEGQGDTEEEARQAAASSMLTRMEQILQEQRNIVQIIKTGRETKQDSANPPFRDETLFSEEEEEGQHTKQAGNAYEEEVVGSSEDEMVGSSGVVAAPVTKAADSRPLETEMMPGAEYSVALVRTDKPGE